MEKVKDEVSDVEKINDNVLLIKALGDSLNVAGAILADISKLYSDQFEEGKAVWGTGNALTNVVDSGMLSTNLMGSVSMLSHVVACIDLASKKAIENPDGDVQKIIESAISELSEDG